MIYWILLFGWINMSYGCICPPMLPPMPMPMCRPPIEPVCPPLPPPCPPPRVCPPTFCPPPPVCPPPPPLPLPPPCPPPPPPCPPPVPCAPCGFGGFGGYGTGYGVGYGGGYGGGYGAGYGGYPAMPYINDCCYGCGAPCYYRARHRSHGAKILTEDSHEIDHDPECNSEKLRYIIEENINDDPSSSKRAIQQAADKELKGHFSVICANSNFSYIAYTETYCQASKNDIICYAFKPL